MRREKLHHEWLISLKMENFGLCMLSNILSKLKQSSCSSTKEASPSWPNLAFNWRRCTSDPCLLLSSVGICQQNRRLCHTLFFTELSQAISRLVIWWIFFSSLETLTSTLIDLPAHPSSSSSSISTHPQLRLWPGPKQKRDVRTLGLRAERNRGNHINFINDRRR